MFAFQDGVWIFKTGEKSVPALKLDWYVPSGPLYDMLFARMKVLSK
jgi:hypothetical protein